MIEIDRKRLREGDQVWTAHASVGAGGPAAWVNGGTVLATGEDGSVVYRDQSGRVDTLAWWSTATVHPTEADAWLSAATRLATIAAQVAEKAVECRQKANGQGVPA